MGTVTILEETTKDPITLIGKRAGVCWGADISGYEKNYKRGLNCLKSNHGRTLEFVNVELMLDGYSARVIREWYTHIGGSPTRLQASTRYVDYSNFEYIIPNSIQRNEDALNNFKDTMKIIANNAENLEKEFNIPREDVAMLFPLGMSTRIIDKRNLRNLIDMSHQRECFRAYWEYRELFNDIKTELSKISEEWKYIVENCFKPKCVYLQYCPEAKSCGYFENCLREMIRKDFEKGYLEKNMKHNGGIK